MADMYLGSQCPMYQNVHIKVFDAKTGNVRLERDAKNRVTKLMLWGIAQFLAGNFNDSNPDKQYEFWPRYIAMGSNKPGADADTAGVSTGVTVLDSRLLNEYKMINTDGSSESVKRINIQGRQHSKINTNFNDPYVKLTLSAYINSEKFDGLEIGEAGLFSKEYDNNCLARVVFPPFTPVMVTVLAVLAATFVKLAGLTVAILVELETLEKFPATLARTVNDEVAPA